ncbi:MAG TPA: site-2 protease family protein [Anaerolineaceae bacterium]|nr:site-2 protease family protein [Anaerolineaceae bacterium]
MPIPYDQTTLDHLVDRVFTVEAFSLGDEKNRYIARYVGCLRQADSAAAYDTLAASLQPYDLTPLFRWEGPRQSVVIIPGLRKAKPSNPAVNLLLFGLTLFSVMLAGAINTYQGPLPADFLGQIGVLIANIWIGWPFALSLLGILVTHEFGHYLVGRYHHADVSLPYFLPFPISTLGTMGAFINMKDPPRNRRVLLDIGIAGPLAGLIVAIPVLLYGLSLSTIDRIPMAANVPFQIEGNSLLYLLAKFAVFGQWLPSPANFGGASAGLYWLRYFFTGQPIPLGGVDVMLHPVALAGWAGILVTSLNLIPAGQLDGGHLFYVLFGSQRARRTIPFILVALVLLGFAWSGWWLWAGLIFLLGRVHAQPLDEITPLDPPRKFLAALGLVIFFLVFTPVPMIIFGV